MFIDNTGLLNVIEQGYRLTHSQGRVILVGVPRQGNKAAFNTLPLHFGDPHRLSRWRKSISTGYSILVIASAWTS